MTDQVQQQQQLANLTQQRTALQSQIMQRPPNQPPNNNQDYQNQQRLRDLNAQIDALQQQLYRQQQLSAINAQNTNNQLNQLANQNAALQQQSQQQQAAANAIAAQAAAAASVQQTNAIAAAQAAEQARQEAARQQAEAAAAQPKIWGMPVWEFALVLLLIAAAIALIVGAIIWAVKNSNAQKTVVVQTPAAVVPATQPLL